MSLQNKHFLEQGGDLKIIIKDTYGLDAFKYNASKGRFGFSTQKQIWQELGGQVDYQTERSLGDRVGWRVNNSWLNYDDLTFSLDAPTGHLPARGSALWARGSVFFGWAWWVFCVFRPTLYMFC